MKKFITILAAFAVALLMSSCKQDALSFEYNFNITGNANGDVCVQFPGGQLDLWGETKLSFDYGSPMDSLLMVMPIIPEHLDKDVNPARILDVAQRECEQAFRVGTVDGSYYLHILGSVKEKTTGIEMKIDKVLTNQDLDYAL